MQEDRRVKKMKQRAYAESVYLAAKNSGGLDEALLVREQLMNLLDAALADANLFDSLSGIDVSEYSKTTSLIDTEELINNVFKGATESLKTILCVMAENNDMRLAPGMLNVYTSILEEDNNAYVVDVQTVVSLDDHLRKVITKKAEDDLKSKVILHEHINPNIIGGIIMSVHDKVVDCSLLYLSEKARMELTSIHISG